MLFVAIALCCVSLPLQAGGQTLRRMGVSAGLGVNYFSQRDVTDMLNGGYHPSKKLSDVHVAVDFSGAFALPVSSHWGIRFEYAYLLNTVNAEGLYLGTTEFTTVVHMPSLLVEYAFLDSGAYNLSVGIGGGYHFGRLNIIYGNLENAYTAGGAGAVILLAGNTAVGEDLFVHLAGTVRVGMLGELRNALGVSPGPGSDGSPARLSTFALGARIGLTYYL
jgi:hypothetical protein